jgi:purine nucleosidase
MDNLIIDVDTGEDDAVAILLALRKNLPLRCVVTSYGNTTLENATRNTFRLLRFMGRSNVPVLRGSMEPLMQHPIEHKDAYASEFVGPNGLCNVDLPSPEECLLEPPQSELPAKLASLIRKYAPVTYIVTGPMTNLARALDVLGDDATHCIRELYVMGGALWTPGNTGPLNPETGKSYAEFNFYCDAHAAERVLHSGIPIHLVTWDTTSTLTLPCGSLHLLECTEPVGNFVKQLMGNFCHYYGTSHARDFEFNDPLTVVAAMGFGSWQRESIRVVTDGERYGQSVVHPDGVPVDVLRLSGDEKVEVINSMLRTLSFVDPERITLPAAFEAAVL